MIGGGRGDGVRWAGLIEVYVGSGGLGGVRIGERGGRECGAVGSGGAEECEGVVSEVFE